MATRLYYSSAQAAPVSVAFGGWGNTAEAISRAGLRNKESGESLAEGTRIGPWTAGQTALDRQYVFPPMSAGISFSGVTVRMQLATREFNNGDNSTSRLLAKIVSEDGGTLRQTLLALGQFGPTTEYLNNVSLRNKTFADGDTVAGTYTTVKGDRLVVEIGHTDAAGSTPEASARYGAPAGTADHAQNETETTSLVPWIEFSNNLAFLEERTVQDAMLLLGLTRQASPLTPAEGLSDNFNDNSRDTLKWNETTVLFSLNPAVAVAETNQQLRLTPDFDLDGFNGYSTVGLFNMTGSHVRVEVVQAARQLANQTLLAIGPSASVYAAMYLFAQNELTFERTNPLTSSNIPYDPAIHHHWRIRHEPVDDTFRFETSLDAVTWTERASLVRTFAITECRLEVLAGSVTGGGPPDPATFDNFNTTASQVYTRLVLEAKLLLADLFTATFVPPEGGAVVHERLIQDSLLLADAPQREEHLHLRESLLTNDQIRHEAARLQAVLDAMLISDQSRQQADRAASIIDRLLLSDAARQQADRQARIQDALLLSDAQLRIVEQARLLVGTVLVSDASVVTADRRRQILDALLLSDVFTAEQIGPGAAQVITRLVQDALLLADVYRREQQMVVREPVGLFDAQVLDRQLILRERVDLLGELSQEALRLRAILDLVATLDATTQVAVRQRLIADAVPLVDAIRKVQEMVVRTPISVVDAVTTSVLAAVVRMLTGIVIATVDPLGRTRDVRFRDPLGRATGARAQDPLGRTLGWRDEP